MWPSSTSFFKGIKNPETSYGRKIGFPLGSGGNLSDIDASAGETVNYIRKRSDFALLFSSLRCRHVSSRGVLFIKSHTCSWNLSDLTVTSQPERPDDYSWYELIIDLEILRLAAVKMILIKEQTFEWNRKLLLRKLNKKKKHAIPGEKGKFSPSF